MLTYLHVKNIALIDELEVDFNEGFNIMTGETGAGKSIIIGSINAVLGNKVSKDFVRNGSEYAIIELIFHVESKEVYRFLEELDIECDGELLISRKINQNGRSVFKLNGQTVNGNDIKNITALLIDLHSQHEHQSLLESKNHIKLLDKYIGEEVNQQLETLKSKYKRYQQIKSEIKMFDSDDETRRREIGFLEFEINEIEAAALKSGEDEVLELSYKKQSNIQTIQSIISQALRWTSSDEYDSASSHISKSLENMQKVKDLDEPLLALTEQLEQIDYLLTDFNRDAYHYVDNLMVDEETLEYTRNRIDLINHLKMKHGNQIEDILEVLEVKREKLDQWLHFEERLHRIQKEIKIIEDEMAEICKSISIIRNKGAKQLSEHIKNALKDLNLIHSKFEIQCTQKESIGQDGWDHVEFMISTNIGEDLKPLIQIASGGELSRVMLAIKSILADCDEIPTLIFDEIDTGISGRTAQMVAEKMVRLSRSRQIICITHLPQIAAMADSHYLIEKQTVENKTNTTMMRLKDEEIPNELSRLIGGAKITEATYLSAVEMKKLANEVKMNNK